ncbi:uncharacterized protein LOC105700806 [Orussus abietinus]|uniref:uncharacterized protein LOC105700806 n=1 Tax=Orussus abietinus TaxID=222816 RepID=UPI0006255CB2|nr:uncharacterized protein LOC105700806 [Orussus abietinus]
MIIVLFHVLYLLGKYIYQSYCSEQRKTESDIVKEPEERHYISDGSAIAAEKINSLTQDFGDIRFFPPVYIQRYESVTNVLTDSRYHGKLHKVVDFGCSELGFFIYLKRIKGIREVLCVDVDREILEIHKRKVVPLYADFLHKREDPLKVHVYEGSVTHREKKLENCDAVVCIELIEHLYPDTEIDLPYNIFGYIKPQVAIITTPNADFNVLFKNLSGFRHPDHKFEWTRQQFQEWSWNIISRYPEYEVSFHGIGCGPSGTEPFGCCSQMAVFHRHSEYIGARIEGIEGLFKEVISDEYPVCIDNRSDAEKILHEATYYIHQIASCDEDMSEEVPLESLLLYMGSLNISLEILKEILEQAEWAIVERENGPVVLIPPQSTFSDYDNIDIADDEYEDQQEEIPMIYTNNTVGEDWNDEVWNEEPIVERENGSIVLEQSIFSDCNNKQYNGRFSPVNEMYQSENTWSTENFDTSVNIVNLTDESNYAANNCQAQDPDEFEVVTNSSCSLESSFSQNVLASNLQESSLPGGRTTPENRLPSLCNEPTTMHAQNKDNLCQTTFSSLQCNSIAQENSLETSRAAISSCDVVDGNNENLSLDVQKPFNNVSRKGKLKLLSCAKKTEFKKTAEGNLEGEEEETSIQSQFSMNSSCQNKQSAKPNKRQLENGDTFLQGSNENLHECGIFNDHNSSCSVHKRMRQNTNRNVHTQSAIDTSVKHTVIEACSDQDSGYKDTESNMLRFKFEDKSILQGHEIKLDSTYSLLSLANYGSSSHPTYISSPRTCGENQSSGNIQQSACRNWCLTEGATESENEPSTGTDDLIKLIHESVSITSGESNSVGQLESSSLTSLPSSDNISDCTSSSISCNMMDKWYQLEKNPMYQREAVMLKGGNDDADRPLDEITSDSDLALSESNQGKEKEVSKHIHQVKEGPSNWTCRSHQPRILLDEASATKDDESHSLESQGKESNHSEKISNMLDGLSESGLRLNNLLKTCTTDQQDQLKQMNQERRKNEDTKTIKAAKDTDVSSIDFTESLSKVEGKMSGKKSNRKEKVKSTGSDILVLRSEDLVSSSVSTSDVDISSKRNMDAISSGTVDVLSTNNDSLKAIADYVKAADQECLQPAIHITKDITDRMEEAKNKLKTVFEDIERLAGTIPLPKDLPERLQVDLNLSASSCGSQDRLDTSLGEDTIEALCPVKDLGLTADSIHLETSASRESCRNVESVTCKESTSSTQPSAAKPKDTIRFKTSESAKDFAEHAEVKPISPEVTETPPNSWSPEIMDSGYPNSASAQDMTPEYDLSSIGIDRISDSESPIAAEMPRLGFAELAEVENGDLANNNRDGEGNNVMAAEANDDFEDLQPLIDVLENDMENENDIYVLENGFPLWLLRILVMANPIDADGGPEFERAGEEAAGGDAPIMHIDSDEGFDSSSSEDDSDDEIGDDIVNPQGVNEIEDADDVTTQSSDVTENESLGSLRRDWRAGGDP